MSSPGIEPGLRPSQGRVRIRHTPRTFRANSVTPPRNRTSSCSFEGCRAIRHTRRATIMQYPDLESNQDLDLRRVQCDPLHHRDRSQSRRLDSHQHDAGLRDRRLSQSSHVGNQARAQGFEPRAAALETACSPRSTLVIHQLVIFACGPLNIVVCCPCSSRILSLMVNCEPDRNDHIWSTKIAHANSRQIPELLSRWQTYALIFLLLDQ